MKDQDLRQSLEDLKGQLSRLSSEDQVVRERVELWIENLEADLASPAEPSDPGLREEIKGMVEQFEVEHPKLTGVLGHLMNTLSSMGI